jgi:phenylacetic acid degradation operon negative regulatory protein
MLYTTVNLCQDNVAGWRRWLGPSPALTGEALARTASDGMIGVERIGRRARWHLTDAGRHLLAEGAERICTFAGQASTWDGRWLILGVTVPDSQRELRQRLKTRMTWAGFGAVAANL